MPTDRADELAKAVRSHIAALRNPLDLALRQATLDAMAAALVRFDASKTEPTFRDDLAAAHKAEVDDLMGQIEALHDALAERNAEDDVSKAEAPERGVLAEQAGGPSGIPLYALLDAWVALGGAPLLFDQWMANPKRTPADAWSQLCAAVRGSDLTRDTNPPPDELLDVVAQTLFEEHHR